MTSFADLQRTFETDPAAVLTAIDGLDAATRTELVLNNLGQGRRSNRLGEDEGARVLPAAYRRLNLRWSYYENLLTFAPEHLVQHITPHIAREVEGSSYIKHTLALLVWKATAEPAPLRS